jgi:hypothetical protein
MYMSVRIVIVSLTTLSNLEYPQFSKQRIIVDPCIGIQVTLNGCIESVFLFTVGVLSG